MLSSFALLLFTFRFLSFLLLCLSFPCISILSFFPFVPRSFSPFLLLHCFTVSLVSLSCFLSFYSLLWSSLLPVVRSFAPFVILSHSSFMQMPRYKHTWHALVTILRSEGLCPSHLAVFNAACRPVRTLCRAQHQLHQSQFEH